MNYRKQRYGPNSYLKPTSQESDDKYSSIIPSEVQNRSQASFADRTYEQIKGFGRTSPLREHNLRNRSPSLEEAMRIEQRHEDLKRQIALKEKQLQDMTGERETVSLLRKRLGLKDLTPDFEQTGNQSRRTANQMDSAKRGLYSSVSPDHLSPMIPSMAGLKSTTYGRPTSLEKNGSMNKISVPEPKWGTRLSYGAERQQLQFHPTRLGAQRNTNPNHGSQSRSPLRSRSRSKGDLLNESQSLNRRDIHKSSYADNDFSKISPYSKNRSKGSNSPLRYTHQPTIQEEMVESSLDQGDSNDDRKIINPKRVIPLRESGRPMMDHSLATAKFARDQSNDESRNKLYRERIEAMTLDNQSLQRRLNQVSNELERIQRENEDIVRQMEMADGDVSRINQLIDYKDDVDAQNNVMQSDLQRMKHVNNDLNAKLKDEEFRTADASTKLGQTLNQRKSVEIEMDDIQNDLQVRLSKYDYISREKANVLQQLSNVNIELDRLTREERVFNHDTIDLETNVARLQNERRDLLSKIERLTIRYDEVVRDITYSKRHMSRDNDWQLKLIVFKKFHVSLDIMLKKRKQATFFEISNYSVFDHKCHNKLKTLALRMEKCGHFQMRRAINKWYDNSLRPYGTRVQNEDISIMVDCNRLVARVFYALKRHQQDRMDVYHFKTNAVNKIWHKIMSDSLKDKKRAMDIWKEKKTFQRDTQLRLKRIFKKSHNRRCEDAFQIWMAYCTKLEYHCRVRVLHMNFTRKAFLSHAFHELKNQTRIQKQDRIRYLNSYYKAWQDFIRYNRHLMQANMAAIAFRQSNDTYTKRAMFQALRQHCESKKYALLNHAVKNDVDVAISSLSDFNRVKQSKISNKNMLRASNITRDCLAKRLFAYFNQWKSQTSYYSSTMDTTVKDKIIKVYLNLMRSYFTQWKKLGYDQEKNKKIKIFQDLQGQNQAMTNEALVEEKTLRAKIEGDKTTKRKTVEKTARHLYQRRLLAAMNRWKDILNNLKSQQGKAAFVIKKMRNRFLRQSFDRYLEFYRWHQQHTLNEKRADYIRDTIRLRELRKMYNHICYYSKWQKKIKKTWHKVLFRFDFFQKQRALKRWKDNGHQFREFELKNNQFKLTGTITNYDDQLKILEVNEHGQKQIIGQKEGSLSKKSYKQIGNYFIRMYKKQTFNHFHIWKAKINQQKKKEMIMRRSIEHYNRRYLEAIQCVFIKFMSDDRRRERLEEIKKTQMECTDIGLVVTSAQKLHQEKMDLVRADMIEVYGQSEETERKVQHTMEWMAQNNLTRVYRSKKRMMFEMWRVVVKEEIAFIYCVKNAIEKSMWRDGYEHIKHQSRDIDFTKKVHSMFYRYSIKGQRIKMGDSFTKWKRHAFSKVDNATEELAIELNQKKSQFEEFRDKASQQNMARVCNYLAEKNTQNVFRAWLKVIRHFKLVKAKTVQFHSRQKKINQKYAIIKWNMRVNNTLRYRTMCDYQVGQYQKLYLRSVFNGWKRHLAIVKRMINSLNNLERVNRGQVFAEMFKNLKAFKISKDLVIKNNQKTGGINVRALIKGYYLRILNQAFQQYKDKCSSNGGAQGKFKGVLGKFNNQRLRNAFEWWKKKHELIELKEDLHYTGPVRAQKWLADREIENLKQFMRDQHYTELEVNKYVSDVCKQNEYLMNKYMTRFRYMRDPNKKLLPQVMDRWKGFVAIRKNVKHQFRFIANFKENQKAEMQIAFNKWRRGSDKLEEELWRLDIKDLEALAWRTTEELKECSEQIGENQAINNHLVLQRDEFLNYYIKGQVLAMALVKDRTEFAKMQSLSRWLILYRKDYIDRMKIDLRDQEYYRNNQEERKLMLEEENETMEEENAEMEQFQQDGEVVKRNKVRLLQEVEAYKDNIEELDEQMKLYQEMKFDLLAKIQEQEEIIERNKKQGKKNALAEANEKGQLKNKKEQANDSMTNIVEETEEQKQTRLKMEQLDRLRTNGPALR